MADGSVVQVIGTVVDVEFPPDSLPSLFSAVTVTMGSGTQVVTEVQQHLGNNRARCLLRHGLHRRHESRRQRGRPRPADRRARRRSGAGDDSSTSLASPSTAWATCRQTALAHRSTDSHQPMKSRRRKRPSRNRHQGHRPESAPFTTRWQDWRIRWRRASARPSSSRS